MAALQHSWDAYVRHAWGNDELMPLTRTGKDSFGGLGATIVDALDTLWLTGLEKEFRKARDWVVNSLNFNMCAALLACDRVQVPVLGRPKPLLSSLAAANQRPA